MQVLLEELEAFKRQLGKSDRKTRDMFDQIFSHQNARGETALGIALSNPQTDDNVVETLIALTSDFDVYETLVPLAFRCSRETLMRMPRLP